MGFFENSSVGPRSRVISTEVQDEIDQKAENGSKKSGQKINFPPKLICVLDAKFNVDCDYAIKLDLAQCYNEVMDVQS